MNIVPAHLGQVKFNGYSVKIRDRDVWLTSLGNWTSHKPSAGTWGTEREADESLEAAKKREKLTQS